VQSAPSRGSLDFDRDRWLNEYDPRLGEYDPRPDDALARRLALDTTTVDPPVVLRYLEQLRLRIGYAALSLACGVAVSFCFVSQEFDVVVRPLQQMLPGGASLIYTDPAEAFWVHMEVGLIGGVILGTPAALLQLWLAVASPRRCSARLAALLIASATMLFLVGCGFSHFVVFPMTWRFFAGFSTTTVEFHPRIEAAFGLYQRLLLTCGLLFETPFAAAVLARLRLITADQLVRNFRHASLLIVVAAAVLTPDGGGAGLVAVAIPILIVYGVSIGIAWLCAPDAAVA